MFSADDLVLGYGTHTHVLDQISFSIPIARSTAIIGPNGSGKSTLLKALSRLMLPWDGEILYDAEPLNRMNAKKFAQKVALLPQTPQIPDDFTVYDLVSQGRFPYRNWMGFLDPEDHEIINQAIAWVRMERMAYRMVSTLSGGERQRAYLAMALAQEPEVLLLDEPTTFLDVCYQFEVMELIQRLNQEKEITIVMVLHDLNHAMQYADEIMVIHERKIFAYGPAKEIITPQLCEQVFQIHARFIHEVHENRKIFIPVGVVEQSKN